MKVQLVSPLPDDGFGYNQGIYWPVGLLTIASFLGRELSGVEIEILDEAILSEKEITARLSAPLIGIQASSCLTYRRVLGIARRAKAAGALVVLGGPFASEVPAQILQKRQFVDAVVVGAGEEPMLQIIRSLQREPSQLIPGGLPGVWTREGSAVTPSQEGPTFDYERARPLDYALIPVEVYHQNYRARLNSDFRGSFQIFTHFGCRYRDLRRRAGKDWCSYCALTSALSVRDPEAVQTEIRETLEATEIPAGSRVMLKCYGDNASALGDHLAALAELLDNDAFLRRFDLQWSMYAQSSWISARLIDIFKKLKVFELYVGFDSVDDEVQRRNGLGTTREGHLRAARLLQDAGIRIQAGFVLGCAGETPSTLEATVAFALELAGLGNVDLYHASPLVVLPGSPAFRMLCEKVPSLKHTDFLDTVKLQREWIAHFCPRLGSPATSLDLLERTASTISGMGRIASSFGGWKERYEQGPGQECLEPAAIRKAS